MEMCLNRHKFNIDYLRLNVSAQEKTIYCLLKVIIVVHMPKMSSD